MLASLRPNRLFLALAASAALLGCEKNEPQIDAANSTVDRYQADIVYTQHGVPHITAKDYASLGYAVGFDQGRENLCTLAEQVRNLRSEKSRYLGAGANNSNLLSDLGYKALDLPNEAKQGWSKMGLSTQQLLTGYADGFNAQIAARKSPAEYPSPCRGADWVKPITPELLLAYHLDVALLASGRNFLPAMASAKPPEQKLAGVDFQVKLNAEHLLTSEGIGSNGWALGKDRVAGANSALLANPHFPWDGELRFYQQHLTIPGELDITGVGMVGLPAVTIGFNQYLGWTHTVSQSKRFTFYQLELDPKNPLRYRYGEEYRDITSKRVTVAIKQADGSVQDYKHTLYFSHYGPMLNMASLSPTLAWTDKSAITFRDANTSNTGMLENWLAMAKAKNADEFFAAINTHQAIPWVNTIMVDKDGTAAYLDATQTPLLSKKAEAYWRQASKTPQMAALWRDGAGSILLPGSDPAFEWQSHPDARAPGLAPFSQAPQLRRNDYVFNSNSSHWLSNVENPLEGYSIAYGPEQNHRSPRTRFNAQLISDMSASSLAGADQRFDRQELKNVLTHNGSLFGASFKNELVERCNSQPNIKLEQQDVSLLPSCEALANWDGRYHLDSRGAHLMREFLAEFRTKGHRDLSDALFAVAFDPAKPATTPSGLAPAPKQGQDPILLALAKASQRITAAGIALDAKLGDIQFVDKAPGQAVIPVSGGYSYEGIFNFAQGRPVSRGSSELVNVTIGNKTYPKTGSPMLSLEKDGNSEQAYRVNYGTSFAMALRFTDQGPTADMFLSYSQSHDPESENFSDQSQLFSKLQWRPVLFTAEDITKNSQRAVNLDVEKVQH